jgi:shikimate dehydrogenase
VSTAGRFGVLGWPVAHSRSPAMMRAAGLLYQHLPVPPELFAETVRALPAAGFRGANVTIPHKEAALALADTASDTAKAIGAANTLTFAAGSGAIDAHNTDGPALAELLRGAGTVMVLGAGGSARAAVWAAREAGAEPRVFNRTRERAERLDAEVLDRPEPADVLVNCTSVGLDDPDATPVEHPERWPLVIDLVYRDGGTRLVREAPRAVDGLDVLVAQGVLALRHWGFAEPDADAMRRAVRTDG